MLRELRDVTAVDGVSVREESHQCPNVIWVTSLFHPRKLWDKRLLAFLRKALLVKECQRSLRC